MIKRATMAASDSIKVTTSSITSPLAPTAWPGMARRRSSPTETSPSSAGSTGRSFAPSEQGPNPTRSCCRADVGYDLGSRGLDPGNIWMVQLLAHVPWIYNEAGGNSVGPAGLNAADKRRYADGLVASVEACIPPPAIGATRTPRDRPDNCAGRSDILTISPCGKAISHFVCTSLVVSRREQQRWCLAWRRWFVARRRHR